MKKISKQQLVLGICIAVVTFILLLVGVMGLLGNEINGKNVVAFAGFSAIVGIITTLFYTYQLKIALSIFIVGLVIGLFQMYRAFLGGMDGWGDLIGVLSLFMFTTIGLLFGVAVQGSYYLYKRNK